ncbi:MAG: sigma 54-interacting transcriptional regulator [Deltaproteobacteria bacterium]|jgi:CRP-like cAMP-binding protein|nr:sigma 54-interacting transcriptional regulator [Deltaproteobacteria bacterium]
MVEKELLLKSPLLRELPPAALAEIATVCEPISVAAGQYIYKKGTAGECFFLVLSGEVELIETRDDNSTCMIGRIGEGGHFGESSLLTGQKRSLSIRAVSDVVLGRFSSAFFHDTLLADPVFHRELDKTLVNRLRFAMRDHVETIFDHSRTFLQPESADLYPFFDPETGTEAGPDELIPKSLKNVQVSIKKFTADLDPVFIIGESGTGRKSAARQIHQGSAHHEGPYGVIDLRQFEPGLLESKLFGHDPGALAFSQLREAGILEQTRGGTIVLYHAEVLEESLRQKFLSIIKKGYYYRIGGKTRLSLSVRFIFICGSGGKTEESTCFFNQERY